MILTDRKPTILIVDDMAANISILHDLLQEDYRIKAAKSGRQALAIAASDDKPDLILLDIEMPEMDGYEVCKELKNNSQTNKIPVMFVTARSNVGDEEHGLNLGAVDYIFKPFHPSIIKIRIKNQINLKLKSDMLEELSMYDGLLHIPNRRYFDEVYAKTYAEAQRSSMALAVLMLDVDFFKPYNDNYGHGKGDECLIKVAAALQHALKRPSDMVARYGGEEFVVILKDIDFQGAQYVGATLVEAVRALAIPHAFSSVADCVTISAGLAFSLPTISKEALLKRADDALYQAKAHGRDRCVY